MENLVSGRWTRENGKPMRLIEVMRIILGEHGGEMPTGELHELMIAGGVFEGRMRGPESPFKTCLKLNVSMGKILQFGADGNQLAESDIRVFSGTTRLKS